MRRSLFILAGVVMLTLAVVGCGSSVSSTAAGPTTDPKESVVKDGIHALQVGVQTWAVDHMGPYPAQVKVQASGRFAKYVETWPTNPYTNLPMTQGTGPGDFEYTSGAQDASYSLVGYGEGGKVLVTVP
jgi:hypothetical protein